MAAYRAVFSGGATSGSGDRAITFTPAVGDLLVLWIALSGNTNATPTCSDNQGGTYTLVMRAAWNASADNMACFVRDQLVTSAVSHVATVASGSNTAGEIHVIAASGMTRTGTSAIRSQGSQANQAAGTPAPTLNQAALTGNVTIVAVASGDTTTTPPAGWTERADLSQSTPTTALEVATRDSGFTGTTITFGAAQSTVYASMAIELDGSASPVSGTSDATLGALTGSAAGTVDVTGSSTATLGALTGAIAGIVDVFATSTATLGALTGAAAGTVEDADTGIVGSSVATLGALTGSAAGTADVAGGSAKTLGALTGSAVGTVDVVGATTRTLGALTGSAAGVVAIVGQLAATLGALTGSSTGTVLAAGSSSKTLGPLTGSAAGTVAIAGASTKTLGVLTGSATGVVGDVPILGSSTATLGALTGSAAGAVPVAGSAAGTLGALVGAAAGTVAVTGSSSATLGALLGVAAGTVGEDGPPPPSWPGPPLTASFYGWAPETSSGSYRRRIVR